MNITAKSDRGEHIQSNQRTKAAGFRVKETDHFSGVSLILMKPRDFIMIQFDPSGSGPVKQESQFKIL